MTKTKLLTYNYKSATLKRADVRKAIKEVDAEYGNERANDKPTVRKTGKATRPSKSSKKGSLFISDTTPSDTL